MELTKEQERFIWLAYAENRKFDDIAKEINIDRNLLKEWNKALEVSWKPIAEIKNLRTRKKIKQPIEDFYKRIKDLEIDKHCIYCKITEEEISKINPETKRLRGKKLELERMRPEEKYDNLQNLAYACYWCNNAKTDTFTYDEFLEIGKAIEGVWKKRLNK